MKFRWFLAGALAPAVMAATPTRYDVAAVLTSVNGGKAFGSKFFFSTGNQVVYRVIPAGGSESDAATAWEFWSSSQGGRQITPASGYETVEVRAANARGEVVGQMTKAGTDGKNAAFYWTISGGARLPNGFDAGFSALDAINATGQGAGFSYKASAAGPVRVTWDANNQAAGAPTITPPAGATGPQIVGVAANGDTLLFVSDAEGRPRLALWNGTESVYVGPAPSAEEEFFAANSAINAAGDVAMLVRGTGAGNPGARLHFMPAADRPAVQTFTFAGNLTSVYNLRLSGVGVASFDASVAGDGAVNVASAAKGEQRTFAGYRSFLNAGGELVFGGGGDVFYWDTAAWSGVPQIVPLQVTTEPGGFDVVGYNDAGRLLALNKNGSSRELMILSPAGVTPTRVTLRAIRRNVRLRVGERVRDRLVETRVEGDAARDIRYVLKGRLPRGFRFRKSEAILGGAGQRAETRRIRVAATYKVNGQTRRSSQVAITVRVR